MERDQFTFYKSFWEAIRGLPKRERQEALEAVIEYALYEKATNLSGIPFSVFTLIRPTLDASRNKAKNRKNKTKTKEEQNGNEGEKESKREGESKNECYIESANADSSADPKNKEPKEPAIITLPLNDGTEYGITEAQVKQWQSLYPSVDVLQQLRNMRGWLDAKPARRKTRRGINAFCVSWLSREQDKGVTNSSGGYCQKKPPVPMGCNGLGEAELEAIQRVLNDDMLPGEDMT